MKAMSWGEYITSKVEGHVLVVTIDKPPFNHVSVDLMSDLALCLEAGDAEPRVRAMVAGFRVAAPEARFAANFVKLAFHPGFGLTHTLPRVIGEHRANLMF